jgi:ABC-2 type transport system ATP-binding protein
MNTPTKPRIGGGPDRRASGGATPAAPAIAAEGLTKAYRAGNKGTFTAVDHLSLRVPAGQVFALLGPNGAGKTTTIKMLAGLITPSSGSARLHGYDITRQRGQAVLQLGAILEGGRNVYWSLSAWRNLLYFGRLKGLRARELKPRAEWLLKDLGLWEQRHQPVGGFSRGMQQKVAVAAALISDPPVVLLDEPTIGLDVQAARTVKQWISRLAHQDGKTIVLTTHQLQVAQELSDRVAILRAGRITADLPVRELLGQFREDRYRITLGARVDPTRLGLPDGTQVAHDNGATVLTAPAADRRALYGLLDRLGQLDLPLASVVQVEPDLEDIFVRLTEEGR